MALPVLYGHLRRGEEGILSIQREERQVLVRATPHGSGEGKEERTQRGTSGRKKKPVGLDSTFSLSLPPLSAAVRLCSVS